MYAEEGATIVIGHNAKNKKEVESMINNKQWKSFIREIPVHKGDTVFTITTVYKMENHASYI